MQILAASPTTVTTTNVGIAIARTEAWAGSSYEARTLPNGLRTRALKTHTTFNVTGGRTVGLADSEYGWTWTNRAKVSAADENTTTANRLSHTSTATASQWNNAGRTGPIRTKTFILDESTGLWIFARVFPLNGGSGQHLAGIIAHVNGDNSKYHVAWAGRSGSGDLRVETFGQGGGTYFTPTQGQLDAGIWLAIVVAHDYTDAYYSVSTAASVDLVTGWSTTAAHNNTGPLQAANRFQIECGTIHLGQAAATTRSEWAVYDEQFASIGGPLAIATPNPSWSATQRDATTPTDSIEVDLGASAATITNGEFQAALTAALLPAYQGFTVAPTFRGTRGAGGHAGSGSYAVAASAAITGTGRYLRIDMQVVSTGATNGGVTDIVLQIGR